MLEFDSFYVKFGGIDDHGFLHARVIVGFSEEEILERRDVEIPVLMKADLDSSLRYLREEAKNSALQLLLEATKLLQGSSAEKLHEDAQGNTAKREAERSAQFQSELMKTLGND